MPSRGESLFVVIEGLDGAGTTTLAGLLGDTLQARDQRVLVTAEPTDGPFGRLLRRHLSGELTLDATTTALVFTADRQDHLMATIRPALARGKWVVSDRYLLSTLAYQGAEGVDPATVLAASSTFEAPDITFVLEVPAQERQRRMESRLAIERYEDPSLDAELRDSYARSIELLRSIGHRIEVLDASKAPEDVLAEVLGRLDAET